MLHVDVLDGGKPALLSAEVDVVDEVVAGSLLVVKGVGFFMLLAKLGALFVPAWDVDLPVSPRDRVSSSASQGALECLEGAVDVWQTRVW